MQPRPQTSALLLAALIAAASAFPVDEGSWEELSLGGYEDLGPPGAQQDSSYYYYDGDGDGDGEGAAADGDVFARLVALLMTVDGGRSRGEAEDMARVLVDALAAAEDD
ncbi:uncharacterized protein LOC134531817 [Bacillus rossius redtenbacheri]|uniref:uncharacterized protein LOC134531817 n=1 Tax=Bacillus rossius redtenbacheri TaxID=93214 RepID=UPI002FDDA182